MGCGASSEKPQVADAPPASSSPPPGTHAANGSASAVATVSNEGVHLLTKAAAADAQTQPASNGNAGAAKQLQLPAKSPASRASTQKGAMDESGGLPQPPRGVEGERADILSKLLLCQNCEEVSQPLAVWCTDCHRAGGDTLPPVYCDACNADLHQFAKTRAHVRDALSGIHTTRMKSAAELGYSSAQLPPGLPANLESLSCSNCDGDVNVYCAQCKTLLCTDCARDIHNPKLLRAHTRTPITCKFIVGGFKKDGGNNTAAAQAALRGAAGTPTQQTLSNSDSAKNLGAALIRATTRASIAPVTVVPSPKVGAGGAGAAGGPVHPRLSALAMISKGRTGSNGGVIPGAANALRISTPPTPASAAAAAAASAAAYKPPQKVRPAPPSDARDVMPVENPGVGGDLFTFGDPACTGAITTTQLELRNVVNPHDMIGTVQVVSIACGMDHAGAVTALGTLFMWGSNVEGQLGCGSRLGDERWTGQPLLIELPRHAPARQVACGSVHTLVLTQDSYVYAFGEGKMGKLGNAASDADQDTPMHVPLGLWGPRGEAEESNQSGKEEVIFIACGQNNSGAVVRGRSDKHQLYIWGEGASGQIPLPEDRASLPGASSLTPKLSPSLVVLHCPEQRADPYPEVSCLAFGTKHVALATKSGAVFTWGDNSFGQLGYTLAANDGDNLALQLTPRLVPKLFLDGVKARAISCGERHTTILSSTGDVWSFGSGESHQIGVMDNIDQFLPQRAVGLGPGSSNPIVAISVGASISAAVNDRGETFLWGYGVESPVPKLVEGLKGQYAQCVAVGSNANLALLTGNAKELVEWQFDGAPLDAEETHGASAGEVLAGVASHDTSTDDGTGHGGKGTPAVNKALRGKKIVALSSGKNHYAAVTADGKLFTWGSNHLFETGLKLPASVSYVPAPLEVKFSSPTSIVEVRCGIEHSIALDSLGRVHTWGTGFEGRLGHVSNADCPQPKLVASLVEAKVTVCSLALGPSNTGVVATDGSCWIWGAGNGGQIGNDELLPQFAPYKVRALSGEKVTQLALGNYHALALTEKKEVWSWGDNKFGQLGLYPAFQEEHAAYPQVVSSLTSLHKVVPTAVECGDNVCVVLSSSGELWGWGTGETMQLVRRLPPLHDEIDEPEYGAGEDVPAPVKLVMPFQKVAPGSSGFEAKDRVKSVSVRDINCCVLTEGGAVYSWGWELGEYPARLVVKKPAKSGSGGRAGSAASGGSGAAAASALAASAAAEEQTWDRVTLGHTRMMLITSS